MKCLFCKNKVTSETKMYNHFDKCSGWCKKCPLPVYYIWEPEKLNEDFTQIIIAQIYSQYPNQAEIGEKYYCFLLNYQLKQTTLDCLVLEDATTTQQIFKINSILDISPNNFFKKLYTYLTFS